MCWVCRWINPLSLCVFGVQDKDFGKLGLYRAHVNPPAALATSLHTYKKYQLVKAYVGETFFWATNPTAGDIVDVKFTPPVHVEK